MSKHCGRHDKTNQHDEPRSLRVTIRSTMAMANIVPTPRGIRTRPVSIAEECIRRCSIIDFRVMVATNVTPNADPITMLTAQFKAWNRHGVMNGLSVVRTSAGKASKQSPRARPR